MINSPDTDVKIANNVPYVGANYTIYDGEGGAHNDTETIMTQKTIMRLT